MLSEQCWRHSGVSPPGKVGSKSYSASHVVPSPCCKPSTARTRTGTRTSGQARMVLCPRHYPPPHARARDHITQTHTHTPPHSLLFHGSFRPEKAEIPPQAGKMQGGGAGGHVAITYLSPPSAYACLPVHAPAPAPATRIHTLCSATSYSPQRECTSNRIYVI